MSPIFTPQQFTNSLKVLEYLGYLCDIQVIEVIWYGICERTEDIDVVVEKQRLRDITKLADSCTTTGEGSVIVTVVMEYERDEEGTYNENIDEVVNTLKGQIGLRDYKEKAKKDMGDAGEKLWYKSVSFTSKCTGSCFIS